MNDDCQKGLENRLEGRCTRVVEPGLPRDTRDFGMWQGKKFNDPDGTEETGETRDLLSLNL